MYTYLYICTTSVRLKREKFIPWSQRSIAGKNVTSTEVFYILPSTKIKFVHGHRILGSLAKTLLPKSGGGNSLLEGMNSYVTDAYEGREPERTLISLFYPTKKKSAAQEVDQLSVKAMKGSRSLCAR